MTDQNPKPPPLNLHARNLLTILKTDHGLQLDDPPAVFPWLKELDRLGHNMAAPGGVENMAVLLDLPIRIRDLDLYRLTFGASFWIDNVMEWYPEENDIIPTAAMIYAMAHCRRPGAFDKLTTPEKTKAVVTRWLDKQMVSMDGLLMAAEHLMPAPTYGPKGEGEGYGPIMSMLLCEIGQTPRYWIHDISAELECEIVQGVSAIKWSEHGDADKPNPFEPYQRACKEWHGFKKEFMNAWLN
jgi:hypothetical protein